MRIGVSSIVSPSRAPGRAPGRAALAPTRAILAAAAALAATWAFAPPAAHGFQDNVPAPDAAPPNAPAPDAAPDAAAPVAPDAGGAEAMRVFVEEVNGLVQLRMNENDPWKKAEVGMELTEGAEFRTGPRSSVVCSIPPDQTIVLDRLGIVKIAEAVRTGTKIKTDLVMKYGRTDYAIEAAGREHESTIRSPSSTLAVRGTSVSLYDQPPFAPEAATFSGRATYQIAKRQMGIGQGARARGGRGSAETAMLESVVDPEDANARTTSEADLIANETSRGAVVTYDPFVEINVVRGGPGPKSEAELVRSLPGVLNFVIRWDANVDMDIVTTVNPGDQLDILQQFDGVFRPQTVLFPGFGLETAPSGGRIAFDHRGGPNGGQEICFWPGAFPTAVYGLGAINNSTDTPVDVRFNAFLNGEKLSLFVFNEEGALVRSKGVRRTVAADDTEASIVFAPPLAPFEDPELIPEVPDETLDPIPGAAASRSPKAIASDSRPERQSLRPGKGAQSGRRTAIPRSEKQQIARQDKASRRAERRMVRELRKLEAQAPKQFSPRPEKSRKR